MIKIKCILVLIVMAFVGNAQRVKTPHSHQSYIRFTENKKQWDSNIAYKAQLDGGGLYIEKTGKLTFHLYDKDTYRARHLGKIISDKLKLHSYSIDFVGSNQTPNIQATIPYNDYVNYFIGKNQTNWASNVQHYKHILVSNLYNGIDALYEGESQSIKYNFIVHPQATVANIKLHYEGVENIKLKNGALYISTSVSESIEQKPFVYQLLDGDTLVIPSKFVLENNTVSFKLLKEYNHNYDLIIDPLLVFAASTGSTADNFGMTATYDSRGNLYTGGTCFDIGYPTTVGAYDISFNSTSGFVDVVITKYDSLGTFLKYSTYLGGSSSSEIVASLIVDKTDNLCLYGATGSTDFPTSIGCYDATFNGGSSLNYPQNGTFFNIGTDIYLAKLNTTGTTLLASTYIGGSQNDGVNNNINTSLYDSLMFNYGDQFRGEIQVDSLGNNYVYSSTKSNDFPMQNALDNSLGGNQDAILIKLNPTLSTLIFSTYIGGSNADAGYGIALDDTLNIYVTGGTRSNNFPITAGSYKPLYGGGKCDGYVCKIKADGSVIMNSSFIGTNSYDQSYFIQLDEQQNVYLFGQSTGSMPVTAGVYSTGNGKQFIQQLNPQLSSLLASTVFGNGTGNINISPSAFSVDCAGNIYLSGWGGNILTGNATNGMPITGNAIQSSTDGFNFYLMVLGPNMSNILFGSYFGGSSSLEHVDGGTSRFDKKGIIYQSVCAGCGGYDDFPVTPGAWPTSQFGSDVNQSSNCNNGVFKIDFQLNSAQANISANTLSGCAPLTVNFNNTSTPGHTYLWDFGGNDTTSQVFAPIKTYTAAGTYTANLYVKTSICNNNYDTAKLVITVYPKPVANFTIAIDSCSSVINFTNQSNPLTVPSKWYNVTGSSKTLFSALSNPSYTYANAGTYTVQLVTQTTFGCKDSITKTIIVPVDSVHINPPKSKCTYETVSLIATGGSSYTWTPTSGLSNPFLATTTCSVQTTTVYTVTIKQNSLYGKTCIKTLTTTVTVYPKITSLFTYSVGACNNNVQFTDASTLTPTSWLWTYGDGNNSPTQNPLYYYGSPGTYTVSLIATNSFGCKDTSKKVIVLSGFNPVTINQSILKCEPDTVQLNATGGVIYSWIPTLYLSNPTIANPLAFPPTTTIYTVTIGAISGIDTCRSNLTTTVSVFPFSYNSNSLTVSPSTLTVGQTATVTLVGFTYTTGVFSLVPSIPFTVSGNNTLLFTPTKSGEYAVYYTDQNNCKHLIKIIFIEVITNDCNEGVVFLPTGFTPNNDGINDILYMRSNFISEIYFTIYDRWGEKLFESNDVKIGWDGTYKGKKLDQGVYGYYITFKCNNGAESFKKGNITLLR